MRSVIRPLRQAAGWVEQVISALEHFRQSSLACKIVFVYTILFGALTVSCLLSTGLPRSCTGKIGRNGPKDSLMFFVSFTKHLYQKPDAGWLCLATVLRGQGSW